MAGQRQVAAQLAQGKRPPKQLEPIETAPLERIPPAPRNAAGHRLGPNARRRWRQFWGSELARYVAPVDDERIQEWIRLVDERDHVWKMILDEPEVTGSKGQKRANPLNSRLNAINDRISECEMVLGINPQARFRLGIHLLRAEATAREAANQRAVRRPNAGDGVRTRGVEEIPKEFLDA